MSGATPRMIVVLLAAALASSGQTRWQTKKQIEDQRHGAAARIGLGIRHRANLFPPFENAPDRVAADRLLEQGRLAAARGADRPRGAYRRPGSDDQSHH